MNTSWMARWFGSSGLFRLFGLFGLSRLFGCWLVEQDQLDEQDTKRGTVSASYRIGGLRGCLEENLIDSFPFYNYAGLAIGGVYSSGAQRLDSHGDVTILRRFTPEPSIRLQRVRDAPERL